MGFPGQAGFAKMNVQEKEKKNKNQKVENIKGAKEHRSIPHFSFSLILH
jgi:hypothetical protein